MSEQVAPQSIAPVSAVTVPVPLPARTTVSDCPTTMVNDPPMG